MFLSEVRVWTKVHPVEVEQEVFKIDSGKRLSEILSPFCLFDPRTSVICRRFLAQTGDRGIFMPFCRKFDFLEVKKWIRK